MTIHWGKEPYFSWLGWARRSDPLGMQIFLASEKLQAMVHLGTANSRMKDFYDLHLLAETHVFYRDQLARAVGATFNRRATPIPETAPTPFSPEFVNESKKKQWAAFLGKNGIHGAPDLGEITAHLAEFLMPVLAEARNASGTPGANPLDLSQPPMDLHLGPHDSEARTTAFTLAEEGRAWQEAA